MQVLARDRQLVQFGQPAPPQRLKLCVVIDANIADLRLVIGLECVKAQRETATRPAELELS